MGEDLDFEIVQINHIEAVPRDPLGLLNAAETGIRQNGYYSFNTAVAGSTRLHGF
jgi:hypothetical protein